MAVKIKVGTGECPACKREVVWRKTEGGALSMFCQHCDLQAYAKDGTEAERIVMKAIGATQNNQAAAAAPAGQGVEPAPLPKPKPTPGLFGGLGL
jgi:endogenous inhibitor of DNA gyrase (YacG/DUF329 family)